MDITTPRNATLSAFYKRSFAYLTVRDRLPRILTQIIDTLVRNKKDIGNYNGNDAKEELKTIIGEISKLKYELQTNKAIRRITSNTSDAKYYNDYLCSHPNITYFTATWLYTECYMYRRLTEMFELSIHLRSFDCFQIQKRESYVSSISVMEQLGSYLLSVVDSKDTNVKETLIKLLKLNLWGNKADLSFSSGQIEKSSDPFALLKSLEANILCDHSEQVWEAISNLESPSQIIDIVLDNAGYELFTDLCVADFLLTKNLAKLVRLYVKTSPYFISDVTTNDLIWTLNEMRNSSSDVIHKLGLRWSKLLQDMKLILIQDDYWITALDYSMMSNIKPQLYRRLSEAKFIIFKGDLNYRKLICEQNWNPTTPFEMCLNGFGPTNLCTIRTVKCDIICGLEKEVVENVEKGDPEWMVTGNYGVIQISNFINVVDILH